jgi:hypothetical protein
MELCLHNHKRFHAVHTGTTFTDNHSPSTHIFTYRRSEHLPHPVTVFSQPYNHSVKFYQCFVCSLVCTNGIRREHGCEWYVIKGAEGTMESHVRLTCSILPAYSNALWFYGCKLYLYFPIYIQQDATLHSLFTSGNLSTCFGWYLHPSSGAQTTVSTASGICQTVTATCGYSGR